MDADRRERMYRLSRLLIGGSREWTHRQHGNHEYLEQPAAISLDTKLPITDPSTSLPAVDEPVAVLPPTAESDGAANSKYKRISQSEPRRNTSLSLHSMPPGLTLQGGSTFWSCKTSTCKTSGLLVRPSGYCFKCEGQRAAAAAAPASKASEGREKEHENATQKLLEKVHAAHSPLRNRKIQRASQVNRGKKKDQDLGEKDREKEEGEEEEEHREEAGTARIEVQTTRLQLQQDSSAETPPGAIDLSSFSPLHLQQHPQHPHLELEGKSGEDVARLETERRRSASNKGSSSSSSSSSEGGRSQSDSRSVSRDSSRGNSRSVSRSKGVNVDDGRSSSTSRSRSSRRSRGEKKTTPLPRGSRDRVKSTGQGDGGDDGGSGSGDGSGNDAGDRDGDGDDYGDQSGCTSSGSGVGSAGGWRRPSGRPGTVVIGGVGGLGVERYSGPAPPSAFFARLTEEKQKKKQDEEQAVAAAADEEESRRVAEERKDQSQVKGKMERVLQRIHKREEQHAAEVAAAKLAFEYRHHFDVLFGEDEWVTGLVVGSVLNGSATRYRFESWYFSARLGKWIEGKDTFANIPNSHLPYRVRKTQPLGTPPPPAGSDEGSDDDGDGDGKQHAAVTPPPLPAHLAYNDKARKGFSFDKDRVRRIDFRSDRQIAAQKEKEENIRKAVEDAENERLARIQAKQDAIDEAEAKKLAAKQAREQALKDRVKSRRKAKEAEEAEANMKEWDRPLDWVDPNAEGN